MFECPVSLMTPTLPSSPPPFFVLFFFFFLFLVFVHYSPPRAPWQWGVTAGNASTLQDAGPQAALDAALTTGASWVSLPLALYVANTSATQVYRGVSVPYRTPLPGEVAATVHQLRQQKVRVALAFVLEVDWAQPGKCVGPDCGADRSGDHGAIGCTCRPTGCSPTFTAGQWQALFDSYQAAMAPYLQAQPDLVSVADGLWCAAAAAPDSVWTGLVHAAKQALPAGALVTYTSIHLLVIF